MNGLYLSLVLLLSYWNLEHFSAWLLVQVKSSQYNDWVSMGDIGDAIDEQAEWAIVYV